MTPVKIARGITVSVIFPVADSHNIEMTPSTTRGGNSYLYNRSNEYYEYLVDTVSDAVVIMDELTYLDIDTSPYRKSQIMVVIDGDYKNYLPHPDSDRGVRKTDVVIKLSDLEQELQSIFRLSDKPVGISPYQSRNFIAVGGEAVYRKVIPVAAEIIRGITVLDNETGLPDCPLIGGEHRWLDELIDIYDFTNGSNEIAVRRLTRIGGVHESAFINDDYERGLKVTNYGQVNLAESRSR